MENENSVKSASEKKKKKHVNDSKENLSSRNKFLYEMRLSRQRGAVEYGFNKSNKRF